MNEPQALTPEQRALRVLLVDDDVFQLEHLSHLLQDLGLQAVQSTNCAREGLAAYRQAAPDLIVCDLCMPQMDGLTFLRQLAVERCACDIVIISGHNTTPPDDPNWPLAQYDGPVLHLAEKMAHMQGLRIRASFEKPLTPEKARAMVECVRPNRLAAPRYHLA